MRSLQMDVDDEISNLVDLHMGMFGGGWKWQDLQGLLCAIYTSSFEEVMYNSRLEKLVEVLMYSPMEVRKGQGEVKGGRVDFGVVNSLLGEILEEVIGEME
ncbi:hypothetical protein Tco_1429817 [Tanacetum coccineum]